MRARESLNGGGGGGGEIWHEEKKRTARRAPRDNVLPDADWCLPSP